MRRSMDLRINEDDDDSLLLPPGGGSINDSPKPRSSLVYELGDIDDLKMEWNIRTTWQRWTGRFAYLRWRWEANLARNPKWTLLIGGITSAFAYLMVPMLWYPMLTMTSEEKQKHSNSTHKLHPGTDMFHGISPKELLVLAMTLGFALGKIPAILFVSNLSPWKRLQFLLATVVTAYVLIVGFFSITPALAQAILMLLGAIPLSSMFGVLTQYLEGRRATEELSTGLSIVLLLGGAVSRSLASGLYGLLKEWDYVPLIIASAYMPVCIVSMVVLDTTPPPTKTDVTQRQERRPLTVASSTPFVSRYWPGLLLLYIAFMGASVVRNFREYYAPDMYRNALGHEPKPWQYIVLELPAAGVSTVALSLISQIKNHRTAVLTINGLVVLGAIICAGSTFLYEKGWFGTEYGSYVWIVSIGTGTYLMYLPGGFVIFDRLVASTGFNGTAAFLIFTSAFFGHIATFATCLYQQLGKCSTVDKAGHCEHKDFFINTILYPSCAGLTLCSFLSIWYFALAIAPSPEMTRATYEEDEGEDDRLVDGTMESADTDAVKGALSELMTSSAPAPFRTRVSSAEPLFKQCPICNARFKAVVALRIHINQEHRHPAWYRLATQVKVKIMALAQDTNNFLDSPPRDDFDWKGFENTAYASMAASDELTSVFTECVPSLTTDFAFWASYSFRVAAIRQQYETGNRQYRHRYDFETDAAYVTYMKDALTQEGTAIMLRAACGDLPEGSVGTFVGVCESSEVEDSILREMILHKDGSSESSDGRDVKAEFDYSEDLCYLYWHQVEIVEFLWDQNAYE